MQWLKPSRHIIGKRPVILPVIPGELPPRFKKYSSDTFWISASLTFFFQWGRLGAWGSSRAVMIFCTICAPIRFFFHYHKRLLLIACNLHYRSYDPAAKARERCVLRKLEGATRWHLKLAVCWLFHEYRLGVSLIMMLLIFQERKKRVQGFRISAHQGSLFDLFLSSRKLRTVLWRNDQEIKSIELLFNNRRWKAR